MATHAHTTRRSLFAIASAAALLPAAAWAGSASEDSQFRFWRDKATQAWARANSPTASEERTRRLCMKAHEYDCLIAETPTRSRNSMAIKMETLERIAIESGDDFYAQGFAQVRAFLQGAH